MHDAPQLCGWKASGLHGPPPMRPRKASRTLPEFRRLQFISQTTTTILPLPSQLAVMLLLVFAASGNQAAAQTDYGTPTKVESPRQANNATGVPEYQFEGGYIKDWLLLGPVMQGSEFASPTIKSLAPQDGGQVTFPNGETRQWQRASANDRGVVKLKQICRDFHAREHPKEPQRESVNHRVVYAYCELVCTEAQQRQILLGMDDGARVWLDDDLILSDVRPDWLALYEHQASVDFSDSSRRGLLLEIHNWGGEYEFACYGGFTVNGRVVYADGTTPAAETLVTTEISGEATKTVSTDISGRFSLAAVPYDREVSIRCLAKTETYSASALHALSDSDNPKELLLQVTPTVNSTIRQKLVLQSPGLYTAVAESPDGLILLADDSGKTVYCYNGMRLFRHPDPLLHDFTDGRIAFIRPGDNGEIWISTDDDGLYRFRDGVLKHWPAEETFETAKMLQVLRNGDVVASFQANLSNGLKRFQFIRIPSGSDTISTKEITRYTGVRCILEVDSAQQEGQVPLEYQLRDDGQLLVKSANGMHQLDTPVDAQLLCGVADNEGTLWFAGRIICSRSRSGVWTEYPTSGITGNHFGQFISVGPQGEIWSGGTLGVCLLRDGLLKRFPFAQDRPARLSACVAQSGSLFLAGIDGGVIEFQTTHHRQFDFRDGLRGKLGSVVTRRRSGVVVSAGLHPVQIEGGRVEAIDVHGLITKHSGDTKSVVFDDSLVLACIGDDTLLAFEGLHQRCGRAMATTKRPYIRRSDGSWQELSCSIWTEDINIFNFCTELADGRVIIGDQQGLVELVDGQAVPCHIFADFPGALPEIVAIQQDSNGAVWAATAEGQLVRNTAGEIDVFDFPAGRELGRTILCEFSGRIWIGTTFGLFYFDEPTQGIRQFDSTDQDLPSVIGLLERPDTDHMWVVTRRAGVFAMRNDFALTKVSVFPDGELKTINSCETSADGRLWLCTDSGTIAYQPTEIAPTLFLDHWDGLQAGQPPMQVECGRHFAFPLAWHDDSQWLAVRYRINEGPWMPGTSLDARAVHLDFDSPGLKKLEFQVYDGEWNFSNICTQELYVFYPLLRDPRMQAFVSLLLVGLITTLAVLWRSFTQARRDRDSILKNLLVEESRAREGAEVASREREMLLARVCHDLRNPLGVVLLVKDMLRASKSDRTTLVDLLDGSVQSMHYMVEQLLTYSKSRAQIGASSNPGSMAIPAFLERFKLAADLRLDKKKVVFEIECATSFERDVWMDENVLLEILNNLFENAAKHTQTGAIRLTCEIEKPAQLRLVLSDTGQGMSQEVQAAIFQPFFKGVGAPQDGLHSVGLGMFIVNELVQRANGEIAIDSELGVGTRVTLTFPLRFSPLKTPYMLAFPPTSAADTQRKGLSGSEVHTR